MLRQFRFSLTLVTASVAFGAIACSGSAPAGLDQTGDDASVVKSCTVDPCGSQCCENDVCTWYDPLGNVLDAAPACPTFDAGPQVGPGTAFAGTWSPIGGTGWITCTDGVSSVEIANPTSIIYVVQTSATTVSLEGSGVADSCFITFDVTGNIATENPPNQGCSANGQSALYSVFTLTGDIESGVDPTPEGTVTMTINAQTTQGDVTCDGTASFILDRLNQ